MARISRIWLIIAQDEASSVVYGMPKEAVELGAVERVTPLPGAPPAARPKGRGQPQNTKAAQEERAAKAAAKRDVLATKQAAAEERMGRPRKTRSDKGTKRGPHQKK